MFSHKMYYWYLTGRNNSIYCLYFLFSFIVSKRKKKVRKKKEKTLKDVSFGGINRLRTLSIITWFSSKPKISLEILSSRLISTRPSIKKRDFPSSFAIFSSSFCLANKRKKKSRTTKYIYALKTNNTFYVETTMRISLRNPHRLKSP